MAASRRKKKNDEELEISEPNLLPIMNIIFMLILTLISMASFVPMGVITTKAPKLAGGAAAAAENPKDQKPSLNLTIFVMEDGFNLSMFGKKYTAPKDNPKAKVLIPKKEESGQQVYDLDALRERILKVKKQNPEEERVTIVGMDEVHYGDIIATMDSIRLYKDDNEQEQSLFPIVAFAAGIF